MIETATTHPPRRADARPAPCALDRHMGPFEAIPELDGWLGADWCSCRACRSTLTTWTALRQRSAA